ncbi:hypothetical protein Bca101_027237 [Brassica carinata]
MSNEPRKRTRGQTTAAMLRKLARNPTNSSPEKLTSANIVDLGESSSNRSRRSKWQSRVKQVTINDVFPDTIQESVLGAVDSEEVADTEDELDQETFAQDEDEELESMEDDESTGFVYQDLGQRIESLRTQHQARLAAAPSLCNMVR